jgi:type III secretion protein R
MEGGISQNQIALMVGLGLLPFLLIACTSFVKIAVVLSLLRNALGIQSIPPNIVIYSMGIVLSAYVMMPVALQVIDVVEVTLKRDVPVLQDIQKIAEPFLDFTEKHTFPKQKEFFINSAEKLWGKDSAQAILDSDQPLTRLIFVVPSFMISELTRAFQIGFLLYLPFIVLDLIVANILLALGMSTMSPVTISLPIKLLLFVGLDGWQRLFEALVLSYARV